MDAQQWIHDNARFKRTITAAKLRGGLMRLTGHCTWCNGKLPKYSRRWCSEECREEGYVRFGYWHEPVKARDKGICALCGFDSLACQRRVQRIYNKAKGGGWDRNKGVWTRPHCHSFVRIRRLANRIRIGPTGQPYEIDHIIPVVEGGGCCGLDNFRTLCFPCHKLVTKALAGRRAAARRERQS